MSVLAIGDEELLDYVIEKDMEDTTARIILACLKCFTKGSGRKRLGKVLRGKDPGYLIGGRTGLLSHFGRLAQLDEDQVLDFIESLTRLGLVEPAPGDLPTVRISERGEKALGSRDMIPAMIPWPFPAREIAVPRDPELYRRLKELRNKLAKEQDVPPYCIMPNSTLVEMVNGEVNDLADLEGVKGMGPSRIERYGQVFLDSIAE